MQCLLENHVYKAQAQKVAEALPCAFPSGRGLLVTGASGLIGSAVVDLACCLRAFGRLNGDIVAVGRDICRLELRFGKKSGVLFQTYREVIAGDGIDGINRFVLAASPASPNLFISEREEIIKTNTDDVRTLLGCISHRTDARSLYVSSSEVYGNATASLGGHIEGDVGEIYEKDPRSCYALSKRRAEEICKTFAKKGMHVVMARPGHIYGPSALECDRRVSSAWAYDAACGRDIIMKSDGRQLRSYTHCLDCAGAILTILENGISGEAYNVGNRESVITIRRLAEILSAAAKVKLIVRPPTDVERRTFNPMSDSSLNVSKLEALGWRGTISADEGLLSTVEILRTGHSNETV